MRFHKRTKLKLRNALRRSTSLVIAFSILLEITYPTQVWALTGGPSQPEVQSFEPIGTSDMVDLFSGDFNYNIPLLDVDGYPINIAYHSGVGMDQEASWVGLGWNINPGVINRNMRGMPDDFSGDQVIKKINMKPNRTWGVGAELNIELYGYQPKSKGSGSVGYSFGFNYNNYTGPSITQGANIAFSASMGGSGGLNGGLGMTSSSDEGLSIQPSVGFSARIANSEKSGTSASLGVSVGTAFNSRGGLQQLSINASVSVSHHNTGDKVVKDNSEAGQHVEGEGSSSSMGSSGVGGTFDFGMPTYTPSITNSMKNYGFYGKFSMGGEIFGVHGKIGVSASFSSQELAQKTITSPAYGYLYSENGQENDNALMDFNREKDGPYNENMASLPVTNYTFDTYGVSGQGVGGSYRPFRSDVGYVFDPAGYTTNDDGNVTAELGLGNLFHVGANIAVTDIRGNSGKWTEGNNALGKLRFSSKGKGNDYENVYFKEANEKTVDDDPAFYADAGGDQPVSPAVDFSDKYEPKLNGFGPVKRKKRAKRTQNFYFLKRSEYDDFAVRKENNLYADAKPHHIAEVTTLATDGSRYIYGIAAYNTYQKEVTFAIGSDNPNSAGIKLGTLNENNGQIGYTAGTDNSTGNQLGVDNFFTSVETPAYAHSYLLTSVLSPDYVDADAVKGPSDGDFGTYTRFAYSKSSYNWRVPFGQDKATYTEGLKSDKQDDKANYIYGEKELWYLDSVITKNYVAVFHTSPRIDAIGVDDQNGGPGAGRMKQLDSISLYSKADLKLNGALTKPIKRVHFVYDNSLCKGIDNVVGTVGTVGKLTLKRIFFTYENSNKSRLSPYIFKYDNLNPNYNIKGYDRWGNYKPNNVTTIGVRAGSGSNTDAQNFVSSADMPTSDFPYVEQSAVTNDYAAAWSLSEIQLPSGGIIKPTYESDDYAYVQNKQAMQMFKIINYDNASDNGNGDCDFSQHSDRRFYFRLQNDSHGNPITDINKYVGGITTMYFRFLVKIRKESPVGMSYDHYEYVSGYGSIDHDLAKTNTDVGTGMGYITLVPEHLGKNGGGTPVNPIVKTAIQYARLYLSKKAYAVSASFGDAGSIEGGGSGLTLSIVNALLNSSFIKNIKDAIAGPNEALFLPEPAGYEVAHKFVTNKSWFRLLSPDKKKLGGGLRVKKIEMIDQWSEMTGGDNATSNYGQEYDYKLDDGTSSGVASYEPQLGGDENPFRTPLPYTTEKLLVPNDEFYQEEPFGESFFPTPSVGYSKVTVKNLSRTGVKRHATGKVVHEFYTAKDFPTITKRTDVNHVRAKDDPFSLRSLLKINVRDYLTAAQGFVIELNDMHGKPKSQAVYQEDHTDAISSVKYEYKQENYLGNFKLKNACTTIAKDGTVSTNTIGEFFDMVADIREDKTITRNISVGINVDDMIFGIYPAIVPSAWPSFAKQKKRFRSATSTKVIQRFGILETTTATDLGSTVATKNLAYDAQTGAVLLTQTTTNFNDIVYSFKYPAWWYYESMGPAYQNIGVELNNVSFPADGKLNTGTSVSYFREGDELELYVAVNNPANKIGWIKSIAGNKIEVVNKQGLPVTGNYAVLKVIRSGKRNTMTTDMATITTLSNPLSSLKSNFYENVLQASAVEFTNLRQTHCDCIGGPDSPVPATINPYVNGTKGNWRPLKSYTHLTGRSQSNYDNNTNIRKDGVFTSYLPFYKQSGSGWEKDGNDWTYVSEVTEYNPFGEELENKDALGRYSSATFGYNQSMALSVAANSQYKEQGFDGFEDYKINPCADDHFKFKGETPVTTESHTGKYSLKVTSSDPVIMEKHITPVCGPVDACNIRLVATYEDSENEMKIHYINATAPYTSSYVFNSGSATVKLTSTGLNVIGTNYSFVLTIKDSKGCTISVEIQSPETN